MTDQERYVRKHRPDHPLADAHGNICEHWLVAEQKLGRHLLPGEVVHHEDGNKRNNHPDNLRVFPNHAAHMAYHARKRQVALSGALQAVRVEDWRWLWENVHQVDSQYIPAGLIEHLTARGYSERTIKRMIRLARIIRCKLSDPQRRHNFWDLHTYTPEDEKNYPTFLAFVLDLTADVHPWNDGFFKEVRRAAKKLRLFRQDNGG